MWEMYTLFFVIAMTGIGGVVWGVRIEGRVNGHQQLFEEREKQHDDRHEDMKQRLTRIESKLDKLNGTHRTY